MYSLSSRLNAIFACFVMIMAALTIVLFLSTFLKPYQNTASIVVPIFGVRKTVDHTQDHAYRDLGLLAFNLNVNLTNLFDWNVKQLFVYLIAEYKSKYNELNQVILWDNIIRRNDSHIINIQRSPPKYYFYDDGTGLIKNKNVTLTLGYNLIPNSGLLFNYVSHGNYRIQFSNEYNDYNEHSD